MEAVRTNIIGTDNVITAAVAEKIMSTDYVKEELEGYCRSADFVFNLAGVNHVSLTGGNGDDPTGRYCCVPVTHKVVFGEYFPVFSSLQFPIISTETIGTVIYNTSEEIW